MTEKEAKKMAYREQQATTLVQALPYIQTCTGKTIVVKYGGNAMVSPELHKAVMRDIILLSITGIKVVLVHGGGPEISTMLDRLQIPAKFEDGMRVTDEDTMEIVQSVLCGKVNKNLVAEIEELSGTAIGLCGLDGNLFEAKKLDDKYGLVGNITAVHTDVVEKALEDHYIPVVATIARGVDGNEVYNINADIAAAELAIALGAEKMILLTDVRGILEDQNDEDTLLRKLTVDEVPALVERGVISGGMIPKVDCAVSAIKGGVNRVHILDGRIPHTILIELFSDDGIGTMFM